MSEALQFLPPKSLRFLLILLLQPANVFTVRTRRRQFQITTCSKCFIHLKDFAGHDVLAPAIYQEMVNAIGEVIALFIDADQCKPKQWSPFQVKATPPILFQKLLPDFLS